MIWSAARITELTELWECNCPTGEIAKIMGLTKNAVIGKAHRLKLPARESPIIRPKLSAAERKEKALTVKPAKAPKPKPKRAKRKPSPKRGQRNQTPPPQIIRPGPLSRHHSCQFIAGKPSIDEACKCGAPAQVGSSYCPKHHAVCWTSVKSKQKAEPFHQLGRKRRFEAGA